MDNSQNLSSLFSDNDKGSGDKPGAGQAGLSSLFEAPATSTPKAGKPGRTTPLDAATIDALIAQEGAQGQRGVVLGIYGQESSGGRNAVTSVDGAMGGMQVMPDTFNRLAKPGERIDNPVDNMRVGVRYIKMLADRFGNDPAKIATGYFSGEGNVNPGQGTAWKADRADGNGKRVSAYVNDLLGRVTGSKSAQAAQPAAQVPDLAQAPKWQDIEAKPEFLALTPAEQTEAKQAYFDHWIAPHAGAERDTLRSQFLAMPIKPDTRSLAQKLEGTRGAAVPGVSMPVQPQVRDAFNAQWDAATPEQRKAMEAMPGWKGQLARDRSIQLGGAVPEKMGALQQQFDPRAEVRAQRLAGAGEDGRVAAAAGRAGAAAGAMPGQEMQALGDVAQPSTFDFETAQTFDPNGQANGLNRIVGRGLAKGGLGLAKAAAGYGQFLADVTGMDQAGAVMKAGGQWARGQEQAIGERGDFMGRNLEGAISSVAQQLPLMVAGVAAGSQAIPLAGMAVQSFGQEYSDGRALGQNVQQATARAAAFAAFEVIGEKFGLRESMEAIKGAARGLPSDQIIGFLASALKKEIPGELLTTTGQFAVDKFAPGGVGLNPNAALQDYMVQVADTIAQTIMQGGIMAGGTTGVGAAVRHMQDTGPSTRMLEVQADQAREKALNAWQTSGPAVGVQQHPISKKADDIVRELAAASGLPEELVLPTTPVPVVQPVPEQQDAETVTDAEVAAFAQARLEQLAAKESGQVDSVATEDGMQDLEIPGQALSPTEQAEKQALETGDLAGIRQFYGLGEQADPIPQPEAKDFEDNAPVMAAEAIEPLTAPAPAPAPAPKTEASAKQRKAIERIAKGTAYFGNESKAQEWVKANGLSDTHEVVKNASGANRWDVVAKQEPISEQTQAAAQATTPAQAVEAPVDQAGADQAGSGEQGAAGIPGAGVAGDVQADGVSAQEVAERADAAIRANDAPGTRYNGQAERDAADKLEGLIDQIKAERNSRPGHARTNIRGLLGELRRERTVVSVEAILENIAAGLAKTHKAQADAVLAVLAQIDRRNGQNDELDAEMQGYEDRAGMAQAQQADPKTIDQELKEAGLVEILPDAQAVADAIRAQAEGEDERDRAMFRPDIKPVSLPRVDSSRPQPKGMEFLSPEAAAAKLAEWKAEADRQGRDGKLANYNRTVISLFDASGVMSQPWVDAGYNVVTYDLQTGEDINDFDAETLLERHGNDEVWAIIGQPPCTDFASSGARWWAEKDADGRTEASNELVRQMLRTVELFRPAVWWMENPVGRVQKLNGLPDPTLSFDPWHFGDPWTKRTNYFGRFNPEVPTAPVEPTEGSKIVKLSSSAKFERSLTPEGVAYAMFMANNAGNMTPAQRLAAQFPGVEADLFEKAVAAGNSEYDITSAIEDAYYESDLETVRDDLAGMASAEESSDVAQDLGAMFDDVLAEEVAKDQAKQRYEYVKPFPGAPAFLTPAQNAVVDFMNGDITKPELVQKFADLDMSDGEVASVTDRISNSEFNWTRGDRLEVQSKRPESARRTWQQSDAKQRRDLLKAAGYTDGDQARALSGTEWGELTDTVRKALDKPKTEKEAKARREAAAQPEQGAVGMKLAAGQVVRTASGRVTTPFPNLNTETNRKALNTLKAVDGWLMGNALAEAESRGDEFNARWMRQAQAKPSQADKDSAEEYLFGEQPPVQPSILKPLSSAGKNTAAALGNAIDGLGALFGGTPGKLNSGIGFDEDTYAKAKPLFEQAIANLGDAKADIKEAMRTIVRMVLDKFGAQAAGNMKPYVVRFIEEFSTPKKDAMADNEKAQATLKEETDAVRTNEVPEGSGPQDQPDGDGGRGDRQPVDAGVADDGGDADRAGRVPAGSDRAGEAGAASNGRVDSPAPGTARDRAGKRSEPGTAKPDDNHVIDADEIGKGGLGKKYRDNVAAIKVLKAIEADGRQATADERKTLAKYVGWGALKGPFDPSNKQWAKQHAELSELLTADEFKAARASVLDAHYTSPVVVGAMYDALTRLGITRGRWLEPSIGIGNFFGLMPKGMRQGANLYGVELDSLTSRLVAALYPKAKIAKATGFQDFSVPGGFFDVVIGNPPFGQQPTVDMDRSPYSGFSVHNYFLAKGIDKLRAGGVMAVVVSHNFLDAQDDRARKWIAERANLIGAVRLPNDAFLENAGTQVVTDILIFQKHDGDSTAPNVADWVKVVEQQLTNEENGEVSTHKVNALFNTRRDLVLGRPTAGGTMYRKGEYTVEAEGDIKERLARWVTGLPADVFDNIDRTADMAKVDSVVPDGVKVGGFFVNEAGKVVRRGEDQAGEKTSMPWEPKNERATDRVKGLIALRDTLRQQMRLERATDATSEEIEASRKKLNALYDDFHKKFGFINSVTNRSIFLDDPESSLVQALEFDYDPGIGKATAEKEGIEPREASATKADIFARRVAFPPQDFMTVATAKDALLASLNYRGRIDADYMTQVYGKGLDQIVKELGDVVYEDPEAGLVPADEYLSGDVKTKLAEAEAAAQADKKFLRNVQALQGVIPKDKLPSEMHVAIGAPYIPAEIYQAFAATITGAKLNAAYLKATGQWLVSFDGQGDTALTTGKFGTSRMDAKQLFELTMLGKGAVVKEVHKNPDGSTTTVVLDKETEAAREKQNAIKAEWQRWLWSDSSRADEVAKVYNEKMNRIVERKYDGGHLTFPGMNPAISLLGHQKNGVWRGLQSYQVLYDHVVGAGKTFEMATLAMEMRRLGISRKPLFVVPNHLTLQWRSEFTRLYPGSNILAATPADFSKENRERLYAKIITGDWDAVIVGHSSLKKFGLPVETEMGILQEQIDEIAAAIEAMKRQRGDRRIVSDMERIKKTLEAKMKEKLAAVGKRSKAVTFDELGVDAMFVDEMHEFKNLTYNSTMDRTPGMGNPAGSAKAFDMFVKVRWLFNSFGDKTPFITATGTPVSNSLVEMFNMQRYMQYPTLKEQGLHVFDSWAKTFGSVENVYEVAPSGSGYRQSTRFAKFTNLPALMGLYNTFADTITLDDLKAQETALGKRFPVPKVAGGRPTLIVAKRSPAVAALMGVPKAQIGEDGQVKFEADLSKEVLIAQEENSDKWVVKVGDSSLGSAETEQDARMLLVQKAMSPVVKVDDASILGRFARLRTLTAETKGKVNALSLTGEANKAGLDYRLVNPGAADFAGSKINLAVDQMMAIYKKWSKDKGAQLVFCDLSIPLSARASYSNKARRLYVRDDAGVTMKQGTLHAAQGQEQLPYFVTVAGKGEDRRFDVHDAVSGVRIAGGFKAKGDATSAAEELLADENNRQAWIDKREMAGEISQEAIDDYNNDNDIEVEDPGAFFLRDDIAGISGASKFSVYDDIRAKLIAKGVPEREIAFIHDYGTPTAKAKLFKAVNAGDVRFLLGSTPKMGAGTNVQQRLVGLHHIDAPWRPSDLEQREGRIIRRGNKLYERDPDGFEVFIGRYATEQTYDTRRWQILEHKARGIEQLRNFDGSINEIDDIEGEAATAADMKAAASGDPLILEETKLRNEVKRLERLQAAHADETVAMTRRAKDAQHYADKFGPGQLAELRGQIEKTAKHPLDEDGFAPIKVDGSNLASTTEEAAKALKSAFERVNNHMVDRVAVAYRGLQFTLEASIGGVHLMAGQGTVSTWTPKDVFSPTGMIQRLKNYVTRLDDIAMSIEAQIEKQRDQAEKLREQAKAVFAQEDELKQAREDHKRVQRALMAKGPEVPENQRAMVRDAMDAQAIALRDMGFNDVVDEFLSSGKALKFNRKGGYTGAHETGQPDNTPDTQRAIQALERRFAADFGNAHPVQGWSTPGLGAVLPVAQAFGARVVGFKVDGTASAQGVVGQIRNSNGFYFGGSVFLNAESDRPHLAVLGHETAHQLKKTRPDLYAKLVNAIRPYVKGKEYGSIFATSAVARDSYPSGASAQERDAAIQEEFVGEVLSDGFMDPAFWQALGKVNKELLTRVQLFVAKIIGKVMGTTGYGKRTQQYLTDYAKVMEIAGQVMAEYGLSQDKFNQAAGLPKFVAGGDTVKGMAKDVDLSRDILLEEVDDVTVLPIPETFGGLPTKGMLYHGGRMNSDYVTQGALVNGVPALSYSRNPLEALEYASISRGDVYAVKTDGLRIYAGGDSTLDQAFQDDNLIDLKNAGYDGVDLRVMNGGGYNEVIVWSDKAQPGFKAEAGAVMTPEREFGYGLKTPLNPIGSAQLADTIDVDGQFSPDDADIRFNAKDEDPAGQTLVRKVQNNLVQFFGNRQGSLKTFGAFDRTLSTQYNKALKDHHFGKVFGIANAMQNHVSLAAIRPAELAPGVLPRVDNVRAAVAALVKGKAKRAPVEGAANAIFAGTLNGASVLQGKVWTDGELRERFRLDDTGIALYRQARAAVDASLDEIAAAEAWALVQGVVPKALRRDLIDHPQAAEGLLMTVLNEQTKTAKLALKAAKRQGDEQRIAEMEAVVDSMATTTRNVEKVFVTAANLKQAGYAPLMRFGQFHVTVQAIDPNTGSVIRDEDGKPITLFFSRYETQAEAQLVRDQMLAQHADDDGISVTAGKSSESAHELYNGISPETMALFAEALGADTVMRKYIEEALSERSALKRRLQREGVAGYSADLPRVLSNFITSNSRHAAQRYYLRDMNQAVKFIPHDKGDVKDEAIALKKFLLDPKDPAAPVSTALFAWFLGGSVAAALVNMTQPFMMTAPYLSQHGAALAGKAMAKALPLALGKKEITDDALRAAMKRASQEGIVDAQEIFHLYSVGAQGLATKLAGGLAKVPGLGKAVRSGSEDVRARINAFMTLWGSMFSLAEGFNRKLTFFAAWDVAKAKGMNNAEAYGFAVRAVNETQGIYNKVNRPNWGRGAVGRTILTFKQFSIMYVEMLNRMFKRGGPEGKRAALVMLAVLMLMAGEEGLPFAQDLNDLIDTIGQAFGYDTNAVRTKRRLAHEILGAQLGDFFLYGASAYMPLDVHGRLGLGNLIPGTSLLKPSDEDSRGRQLAEVVGAAGGLAGQVGDAYDAAVEGNTGKALQNLAPKAIKDVLAAGEMARRGFATDAKGRKVADTDGLDAGLKAIGFNPTSVANEHRKAMPLQQDMSLQRKTEASIVGQWARAAADGDDAGIEAAQKRLDDWNRKNPETPIVIKPTQIRARMRQMGLEKDVRVFKALPAELRGRAGEILGDEGE